MTSGARPQPTTYRVEQLPTGASAARVTDAERGQDRHVINTDGSEQTTYADGTSPRSRPRPALGHAGAGRDELTVQTPGGLTRTDHDHAHRDALRPRRPVEPDDAHRDDHGSTAP